MRPDIADSVRATMNFNLPGSVPQHYHMDGLYTKEFLICNIAVVDTDLVNGAIDVLPGHQPRVLQVLAVRARAQVPADAPGCRCARAMSIVRKSTLWHRGMPNTVHGAAPDDGDHVRRDGSTAPTIRSLINDGQIEFYPNWFNTSRLGQLRERTFVTAPITYSAYRFARSLYGNKGYDSF